ncbi:MAG: metal ABC transporter permease [Clostridia bacterium]|nr:metal ABC transporter permease [Clostridia bacterium]
MREIISNILSYQFLTYGLIVGLCVSLCASILGVILVLKRYSMIGDGLSHISFGALALASVLGFAPLKVAIPLVAISAILLLRFGGKIIKGDSLIAIISSSALAIGILLISYFGSGTDMNSYLIGSLYAVEKSDAVFSVILCLIVMAIFVFLYNRVFSVTFDEEFSRATGMKVNFYNTVIAILVSVTVVIGMRLMGALLISALIVFPALSSMRVFKSFFSVTVSSVVISAFCFLTGFFLTIIFDSVPAGSAVTLVNLAVFIIFSVIGAVRK